MLLKLVYTLLILLLFLLFTFAQNSTTENSECHPPCQNGGICHFSNNTQIGICQCLPEWVGSECQFQNLCSFSSNSSYCLNGGICLILEESGEVNCECRLPFEGVYCQDKNRCQIDEGECIDDIGDDISGCYPCVKNSFCSKIPATNDTYTCLCQPQGASRVSNYSQCYLGSENQPLIALERNFTTEDAEGNEKMRIIPWVVGSALLLYILLFLLLGARRDRPNLIVTRELFDRFEEDEIYLVTFQLGNGGGKSKKAGSIHYRLYGSRGESKVYTIDRDFLQTRSALEEDHFLISSKGTLGQIKRVRVWQECPTKNSPYWQLERVVVRNVKTDQVWFFLSDLKRLKTKEKKIWMVFEHRAATEVELRFLQMNYCFTFYDQLKDHHIWITPSTAPPRSLYNRRERLTVLMSLLSIYFASLLLLYGEFFYLDPPKGKERGSFLTLYSFLVGSFVCMAAFPISLGLIWLFSGIKRRRIPTLVVLRSKKNEGEVVQRLPRKEQEVHLAVENQESRWDRLDRDYPDRIMVEAEVKQSEESTSSEKEIDGSKVFKIDQIPLGKGDPGASEVKSQESISSGPFRVPSTDQTQLETWISHSIKDPKLFYPDNFIHNFPPKHPTLQSGPENAGELGKYGALEDSKAKKIAYKGSRSTESLERAIDQDIKKSPTNILGRRSLEESREAFQKEMSKENPEAKVKKRWKKRPKVARDWLRPLMVNKGIQTEPLPSSSNQKYNQIREKLPKDALKTSEILITRQVLHIQIYSVPWDYKGTSGRKCRFPEGFLPFAWAIHLILIGSLCTLTIIFSFNFEYKRSLEWLGSLFWAVIGSLLILETIKIAFLAISKNFEVKRGVRTNLQMQRARDDLHLRLFYDKDDLPIWWVHSYIIYNTRELPEVGESIGFDEK